MQGVLAANADAAALFCTVSDPEAVRAYFASVPYSEPELLADALAALDQTRRARVLTGEQLLWLDGDNEKPIALYPNATDLLTAETALQEGLRYYAAVFADSRLLWIGEATDTFVLPIEPSEPTSDPAPHADEELYDVQLVRSNASGETFDRMKGFQLAFRANPALVSAENTSGYLLFFSSAPQERIEALLSGGTTALWKRLDAEGRVKIIRDLSCADGQANTFYASAVDLVTEKTPLKTPGVYRFFAATLDAAGVVRYLAEAGQTYIKADS